MSHTDPRRPGRRQFLARAVAAGALPALAGPAAAQTAPLRIVATTSMLADLVRTVAGDLAQVQGLMGAGIDPHSYRATRSDIAAMADADAVFWHGLNLEVQLRDFLNTLAGRTEVTALADTLRGDPRLLGDPEYADQPDPHVWMDPLLWSDVAAAATDRLTALAPDAADTIAERAAEFDAELRALDTYTREVLGTVPEGARVLLTAHDAFAYFGAAYGWEVMGIQGISTDSEAGIARITELVDVLVDRRIGAVFVESSVSDRNVRALIEGAGARGHTVRIGAELYSDAMGPAGSYEGTYPGMIDHNVTRIATALGGRAPEGGRLGRLAPDPAREG